jgi:predicted AlkP superfamily phosphohydrolase/phosphomutase
LTDIDVSRTQAFALPTDLQGYIRVNLQGREPQGTVPPQRYDGLCDTITEELHALRDQRTNDPVVETVFRTRDMYREADHVDCLPDLCVVWKNASAVSTVYSALRHVRRAEHFPRAEWKSQARRLLVCRWPRH